MLSGSETLFGWWMNRSLRSSQPPRSRAASSATSYVQETNRFMATDSYGERHTIIERSQFFQSRQLDGRQDALLQGLATYWLTCGRPVTRIDSEHYESAGGAIQLRRL